MKSAIILAFIFASALSMNMISIDQEPTDSNNEAAIPQLQRANNLQITNYTG